jgi:CRISPR/Cas system-associated endonuclease Cas1
MSKTADNKVANNLIAQKLQQKALLLQSVSKIDNEILQLLSMQQRESHQPLTQDSLKEMINLNLGDLKVTEHMLFAGVASATYYKVMNDVQSVKVKTLMSVLDTIGLTLFIGRKPAGPGA